MSISRTPHDWSKDALLSKAQRYIDEMLANEHSDWRFGFWSALALELLVKAALASLSPVLIAEGADINNLLFAIGHQPNQKKFNPRSADISTLLRNLVNAFPGFTDEMKEFGITHIEKRNSEIHSGALPFDDVGTSSWLPKFYLITDFLLTQMKESLDTILDASTAEEAREHIKAYKDEAAKSVKQSINAHATIWKDKSDKEKAERRALADATSLRYFGHRVNCPSCDCVGLLRGSPAGIPKKEMDEEEIVEKQRMLPSSFECPACELKITGYSKLIACGLGDAFISTSAYSPIDYFNIDIEDEYRSMMGDDNNE